MSLESPLGKFIGHGSARDGTGHWWSQKLTAVALIPLTIWFVFAVLGMDSFDYASVRLWIGAPLNAILLILFTVSALYHSDLGLQVVVEDYVHGATKVLTLMVLKFMHVALAVAVVYSIIIISLGSIVLGSASSGAA
jgi:succinate dehydrogenase / fumarate reductase, membrane anchor subunit